jgi:hypothetical protein
VVNSVIWGVFVETNVCPAKIFGLLNWVVNIVVPFLLTSIIKSEPVGAVPTEALMFPMVIGPGM